jgi:hypothetical protein
MMKHTGGELCSGSTPIVLGPPNQFGFELKEDGLGESGSTVRVRAAACSAPAMCLSAAGGKLALAPCDQPSAVFMRVPLQNLARLKTDEGGAAGSCTTAVDCGLNGRCAAGVCRCKTWWRGPHCQFLNLAPARSLDDGLKLPKISTWGASALWDDGLLHVFTAEMANHCGIKSFQANSFCSHFAATSPEGPFHRVGVIQDVMCHNPTMTRLKNGTWLLFHINGHAAVQPPRINCTDGSTPAPPRDSAEMRAAPDVTTSVLAAETLDGPWRNVRVPTFTSAGLPSSYLENPAPLPPHSIAGLPDDSDFPVCFCARDRYAGCPNSVCPSQLGMARGKAAWDEGFTMDPKPICSGPGCGNGTIPDWRTLCEDPFYWIDGVDNTHHLLCNGKDCPATVLPGDWHQKQTNKTCHRDPAVCGWWPGVTAGKPFNCNGNGMHAYSQDGVDWRFWADDTAYNTSVQLTNGSVAQLGRRERPHILFNQHGVPTHFWTAVISDAGHAPGHPPASDRSWSFVQAFAPQRVPEDG